MRPIICMLLFVVSPALAMGGTVNFEHLATMPARTDAVHLYDANGGSQVFGGVDWGTDIYVVGDRYRVDTVTPGPTFGVPNSGHFFITNGGDGVDGVIIQTDQILTGSWWARSEYYGYSSGALNITLTALSGLTELGSIKLDLPAPPSIPGQKEQPQAPIFLDSSAFASYSGITGYRIDREANNTFGVNWVADDFRFASATVPEPSSMGLLASALLSGVGFSVWRRRAAVAASS